MDINWLDEPEIPISEWADADAGFGDLFFTPVRPPEPDPEMTPQQRHDLGFRGESYQGDQLGGFQGHGNEPRLPMRERDSHGTWQALREAPEPVAYGTEMCVLTGWPRRHVHVAKHCPHGQSANL